MKFPRLWLCALLIWLGAYHATIAYTLLDEFRFGRLLPAPPITFEVPLRDVAGLGAGAYEAGVRVGDTVETIDGKPFDNMRMLYEAVNRRRPGDLLPVTVRSAKGTSFAVDLPIPPLNLDRTASVEWIGAMAIAVAAPVFFLSIGFWVLFQRPRDRLSWLALCILLGFSGWAQEFPIAQWPDQIPMLSFWALFESPLGLSSAALVLFAWQFPAPARLEQKFPWVKYVLAAPFVFAALLFFIFELGREISFAMAASVWPLMRVFLKLRPDLSLPWAGALAFIAILAARSRTASGADAQRRIRILSLATSLSAAPAMVETLRAFRRNSGILDGASLAECAAALLPLLIFPFALSYVILIRRAMDVGATIRHGMLYLLTGRGLTILHIVLTAAAIGAAALVWANQRASLAARAEIMLSGALLILGLRPGAQWLAEWIDRGIFREAQRAEDRLRALAERLRLLMEEHTLIQTLAREVSAALRVPAVTFLANGANALTPAYSTAEPADSSLHLSENSGVVRHFKLAPEAAAIDFDDPGNWIQSVHPSDKALLRRTQTEVLLPLSLQDKLLGILALGPKVDEAPYTARELNLLDMVAAQAGLALENSRLARQMAHGREGANS